MRVRKRHVRNKFEKAGVRMCGKGSKCSSTCDASNATHLEGVMTVQLTPDEEISRRQVAMYNS